MSKTHNIKDFIGTFDGFISEDICKGLIDLFEKEQKFSDKIYDRKKGEGASGLHKKDFAMSLSRDTLGESQPLFMSLLQSFRETLDIYLDETDFLSYTGIEDLHFTINKIQKTLPSGGYHVWHCEKDYNTTSRRVLVYTIYLNDILAGGETEFLIQKTRVSPKQGRVCIFPAPFPWVHRGNPPLDKTKYIVTSWLEAGLRRSPYN